MVAERVKNKLGKGVGCSYVGWGASCVLQLLLLCPEQQYCQAALVERSPLPLSGLGFVFLVDKEDTPEVEEHWSSTEVDALDVMKLAKN